MMKLSKNRIISIILSITMLFSVFFAISCQTQEVVVNNNHVHHITETDSWLVSQAKCDYKIVISKDADKNIITASRELQTFFLDATGIALPIITDEGLTFSEQDKYLSIGKNALSDGAGITARQEDLKKQGFYVKTVGKSIFMIGATSRASLYAVYEYLSAEFNYEYCFTDVYYIDKNVTDKKLNNYSITEIPDIDMLTVPSVGYMQYNSINANRFRVVQIAEWSIPQNNYNNVHNAFQILPPTTFIESHPDWYTTSNPNDIKEGQLCFTAHTDLLDPNEDFTEYNAMIEEILKVIQSGVKKSSANIFTISQRDNKGFCNCDYCNKVTAYYGAKSSLLVLLCNKLSDRMAEWFETEEGKPYKREFNILFLAYQDVESAPTVYNSKTGKYEPTKPEMVCRDNVGVQMASLSVYNTFDFTHEVNAERKENILSWGVLTNKFTFWTYDVNFQNYFMPYDSWNIRKDFYKLLADIGTMVLNDQGQTQNIGSCTAWGNLKSYLSTKLRWNTDVDLQELTKNYFDICYKTASNTMYDLYLQYKAHANDIKVKFNNGDYEGKITEGAIGDIFGGLENSALWEKPMVTSWYNHFLKALNDLEPIKDSDPKGYESAYKMISAELASPLYMLIKLYGNTYSEQTLSQMKEDFKYYCTVAGINYYKDSTASGGIENLYKELGIA